jgi:hypothetical protein
MAKFARSNPPVLQRTSFFCVMLSIHLSKVVLVAWMVFAVRE